ncbi:hypothetical protein N9937_00100 [bacterium]|nr:hypothetical protein [bacterium]
MSHMVALTYIRDTTENAPENAYNVYLGIALVAYVREVSPLYWSGFANAGIGIGANVGTKEDLVDKLLHLKPNE